VCVVVVFTPPARAFASERELCFCSLSSRYVRTVRACVHWNNTKQQQQQQAYAPSPSQLMATQPMSGEDSSSAQPPSPPHPPRGHPRHQHNERHSFSQNDSSSVTRCVCGENANTDGYMIQCETCYVWQHGDCVGISPDNEPEEYFCELCYPDHPIHKARAQRMLALEAQENEDKNVQVWIIVSFCCCVFGFVCLCVLVVLVVCLCVVYVLVLCVLIDVRVDIWSESLFRAFFLCLLGVCVAYVHPPSPLRCS